VHRQESLSESGFSDVMGHTGRMVGDREHVITTSVGLSRSHVSRLIRSVRMEVQGEVDIGNQLFTTRQ
jgi:hypothetical protein